MIVTGVSPDGKTWTVARGVNGTVISSHMANDAVIPNTIQVASIAGLSVGSTIQVGNELMTVTAVSGMTSLTVARGVAGTAVTTHANGDTLALATITVADATGFKTGDTILVGSELMTIIAISATNLTVLRGVDDAPETLR